MHFEDPVSPLLRSTTWPCASWADSYLTELHEATPQCPGHGEVAVAFTDTTRMDKSDMPSANDALAIAGDADIDEGSRRPLPFSSLSLPSWVRELDAEWVPDSDADSECCSTDCVVWARPPLFRRPPSSVATSPSESPVSTVCSTPTGGAVGTSSVCWADLDDDSTVGASSTKHSLWAVAPRKSRECWADLSDVEGELAAAITAGELYPRISAPPKVDDPQADVIHFKGKVTLALATSHANAVPLLPCKKKFCWADAIDVEDDFAIVATSPEAGTSCRTNSRNLAEEEHPVVTAAAGTHRSAANSRTAQRHPRARRGTMQRRWGPGARHDCSTGCSRTTLTGVSTPVSSDCR